MADLEFEELCAHIEDELGTATNGGTAAVTRNYKLCHDVTPLEENKSFLEKVRLGGLLCGLHEDSIKALTRNNEVAAAVLAASANLEVENPLTVLSCQQQYRKQQGQNGASPRRRQYQQLQTQPHQNGHRMQDPELNGDIWSSSEDEDDENNLESVISKSIRWNDDAQFGLGGGSMSTTAAHAHTLPRRSAHILQEKHSRQSPQHRNEDYLNGGGGGVSKSILKTTKLTGADSGGTPDNGLNGLNGLDSTVSTRRPCRRLLPETPKDRQQQQALESLRTDSLFQELLEASDKNQGVGESRARSTNPKDPQSSVIENIVNGHSSSLERHHRRQRHRSALNGDATTSSTPATATITLSSAPPSPTSSVAVNVGSEIDASDALAAAAMAAAVLAAAGERNTRSNSSVLESDFVNGGGNTTGLYCAMTASNGGGGSVSPPGPGAVYHGYDSGHSTSHSPNEDAIAVAANSAKSSVLSREAANKLVDIVPHLIHVAANKKSASSSEHVAAAVAADYLLPPAPSAHQLLLSDRLDELEPTHRGLHRFQPRHKDEIDIDIGDPVYVQKEAEDLWCEGANLRTGLIGIFPIAHVVDVDYSDFDPNDSNSRINGLRNGKSSSGASGAATDVRKERYLLEYIGSVESGLYKGTPVLIRAVRKILSSKEATRRKKCVLEISDKGIKMIDKSKGEESGGDDCSSSQDYFYNLKNVTFCGFHPSDLRYFGFVTKHPRLSKYACHVFVGADSTQHVAEACGRAFNRFYQKFMEATYPVEDIYLE